MTEDEDKGYSPDPPSKITYLYTCDVCGAIYETFAKASNLNNCRNIGCSGIPKRK